MSFPSSILPIEEAVEQQRTEQNMKPLVSFRSFRYKLKRRLTIIIRRRRSTIPLLLRRLRLRPRLPSSSLSITSSKKTPTSGFRVSSFFSTIFCYKKMDRVRELRNSFDQGGHERLLLQFPCSPNKGTKTPKSERGGGESKEVEDACRSFENYLVEMIVQEGKVRDLMDVEELLYCWKNLKCPVFIDLVSRFYGELCKDLFMAVEEDDTQVTSPVPSS